MYQFKHIPSEAQIRKFLRRTLFGKNMYCPRCRSRKVVVYEQRYRCKACKEKFTLFSHTWLKGMKLSVQKFWLLLWCWTTQIPVRQAQSLSGCSEETVRRWYGNFRHHLPQEIHILEHIVQCDEAYFRDQVLIIAKQCGTRKLAYAIVPGISVGKTEAMRFLFQKVKPGSRLWTDGAAIYRGVEKCWPVIHERDIHSKWEFGKTSEIEGIIGNYRTFVRRMYHHHWSANLPEYVREFCFRFSSPEIFQNPHNYLTKTLSLVPFD